MDQDVYSSIKDDGMEVVVFNTATEISVPDFRTIILRPTHSIYRRIPEPEQVPRRSLYHDGMP